MKFTAFFLERDIVIHTSTGDIKYCGSPYHEEGDSRVDNQCTVIGPSIHIANIGDYHFQSIIPINQGNAGTSHQAKLNQTNKESKIHNCKICGYSTSKTSHFTRHELACKKKQERIRSKTKAQSFDCLLCGKTFQYKRNTTYQRKTFQYRILL